MLIRDDVLQFVHQASGRPMYDAAGNRVELPDYILVPLENFLRASHRVGVTVPNPEVLAQLVALAELWSTKPGNRPAKLPLQAGEETPSVIASFMAGYLKPGDKLLVRWRNRMVNAMLLSVNSGNNSVRVQLEEDGSERVMAAHLAVLPKSDNPTPEAASAQ